MYVFASETVSVRLNGYPERIVKGYAYRNDDPVVLAYPDAFQPEPSLVARSSGWTPEVEQATAAPGEKRAGRRAG